MSVPRRAAVQLAVAMLATVGCVWSWLAAQSVAQVAPIADGQPATTSVLYDAPLLSLSLLLAAVAGVLAVLGLANLRNR